jgi:nucleotide-binding universal stress UspA family protein
MEKILVAIDANQINKNVLNFACFIAKLTHSKLTGVFLENNEKTAVVAEESLHMPHDEFIDARSGVRLRDDNIHVFKEMCANRGANCAIHLDRGVPVADIIKESRFADLLIVDPEMSFRGKKEAVPTDFIKEVLTKSECPVVIAPFTFHAIDEVLLCYDGSPASVFAIRQFTYLFPALADKRITILQVNEKDNATVIEKEKIGELLQMHYSAIGFKVLQGKASNELFGYLLGKKNVFVVMGAFGRSMLSDFFKHSTAELVIKTINLPVFIAHHK